MDRTKIEHILSYGYLTEDERRDVESYVSCHPEYAPILEEARLHFDAILTERSGSADDSVDVGLSDDQLVAHIVDVRLGHQGPNDPRIRRALDDSPAFRDRYETLAGRVDRLSSTINPAARFEQLSGHRLAAIGTERAGDRPARGGAAAVSRRRVSLVVGVLLVLLTVGISSARLRAIDGLAYGGPEEVDLSGYDTPLRGEAPPSGASSPDLRYRYALSSFKHARQAGMGLFPRYDAALLVQAEEQLRLVIASEPDASFLSHEARFTLARVYLAADNRTAAREVLNVVAAGENHRAAPARALLARIGP